MSNPTPGPWAIDWNISRIDVFSSDAATLIATLRRSSLSAGIDDAAKANARLIAAAPELFEAARNVVNYYIAIDPGRVCLNDNMNPCGGVRHWGGGDGCPLCSARAALAKAMFGPRCADLAKAGAA